MTVKGFFITIGIFALVIAIAIILVLWMDFAVKIGLWFAMIPFLLMAFFLLWEAVSEK